MAFPFFKIKPSLLLTVILTIFLALFFSYKITSIPTGLTVDESAFGYNAALLAKTAHDENGRFLPIFVHSTKQTDWRQPVTQYYLALIFKLFGPSIFNLRFSSVLVTIFSAFLIYYLSHRLFNKTTAVISFLTFLTTPIIMLHSHLGLDNIMPIPFTIIWLYALYSYSKNPKPKFLIYAGITLGINFYTYKGMRAVIPVWCLLTVAYLCLPYLTAQISYASFKNIIGKALPFCLAVLPFFLIIPLLETKYPGAVFSGLRPQVDSLYDFFYPYLSSFDLTFLFIQGDALLFHSTGQHGMFLLSTLPFFLWGIYLSAKRKGFSAFILAAFFLAPLFYGLVNSVHRASRLMCLIPLYVLIGSQPIYWLSVHLKSFRPYIYLSAFSLLIIPNYFDFVRYYWTTYPKFTENIFGHMDQLPSYQILAQQAQELDLKPYITSDINELFFEQIFFTPAPPKIHPDQIPPQAQFS